MIKPRRIPDGDFLDLVQESVVICDLNDLIIEWNSASEELYGWSRSEAVGMLREEVFADASGVSVANLNSQQPYRATLRRRTKFGSDIWVRVRQDLREFQQGSAAILETGIDVTYEKSTEMALMASEGRLSAIRANTPASVLEVNLSALFGYATKVGSSRTIDVLAWLQRNPDRIAHLLAETKIVDACDTAIELLGGGNRDAFERGLTLLWPPQSYQTFHDLVLSGVLGNRSHIGVMTLRTANGREFDADVFARFPADFMESGEAGIEIREVSASVAADLAIHNRYSFYYDMFRASSVSAWHLDITYALERMDYAKSIGVTDLAAYCRENPQFVRDFNSKVRVVDVNSTTVQLFEAKDRSEIVGKSVLPYWIENDWDTSIACLETMYNGGTSYTGETKFLTLRGNIIHVIFSYTASRELNAQSQGLLSIVDITDRVRSQNALAESQASLAHATRVAGLGELAASIAHEVNQPLTAITTMGETALRWLEKKKFHRDELRDLATRMIEDARRAATIVGGIRAMAAPQETTRQLLSLNGLVSETMPILRPEFRRFGIADTLEFEDGVPLLFADSIQIQQVVMNLALNACHAMQSVAERRLTMRTSYADGNLHLVVQDTGCGFPPEDAERLFQSFFTTNKSGMGLGLAICRSIVESHGGRISVANVLGGGAAFTVMLPPAENQQVLH